MRSRLTCRPVPADNVPDCLDFLGGYTKNEIRRLAGQAGLTPDELALHCLKTGAADGQAWLDRTQNRQGIGNAAHMKSPSHGMNMAFGQEWRIACLSVNPVDSIRRIQHTGTGVRERKDRE